jgi:hypothetical protein
VKTTVTNADREESKRIAERVSRGLIDDAEIDAPDGDESTRSKQRRAPNVAAQHRAAPDAGAPRRRKPAPRVA